jgi:ABC-2 type transport system permease protein
VLLAIGLVVYGAVFAFVGAQFKRPLLIGLVFIFGWEQIALTFPGYLRYYTVIYYVQALVPHAMPNDGMLSWIQGLFRTTPGLTTCLVSLTAIWGAFLWLASRVVDRKEYVLEQ